MLKGKKAVNALRYQKQTRKEWGRRAKKPTKFDDFVAKQSTLFRRRYRISLPDAAIAATAYLCNAPLITRDRQLKKIKEITVIGI